ncbi:response regulator [Leptolyngbya sp. NK1-12]|uniref:histidine kinase n=1 Tax=Leptolyngbya sp. NK1-12 TaxID=2547451 RepID=A0AA96WHJ5_9CYAN|nr:response regulator [Leptolyngbya sp. NK1-12]
MSKSAIICVDDEPTVLESLKIELKQVLGDTCLIETAESGEEALELFGELQVDQYEIALVFADQIMPGMRGDELLQQIHTRSPQTLNIMITGHADLETLGTAIRSASLYRYIAKPWQSNDLRSTVLEAIQNYHRTRELELQNSQLQATVQQLEQSLAALQQSKEQLWQQTQTQEALSQTYLALAMQQVQLYQALQSQIEDLEYQNQLKDNFLDSISHELRSPISNIRMATQMLEVRLQQLGVPDTVLQCDRYLQILRTECQKEADLLNDLLALMRLDSGSESLNLSTVSLNLWIPHIAEPFIERMQERQQHLQIEVPPALPNLTTDLFHLERTLTELLTNAWKYTPAGETITVTVQVLSTPPDAGPSGTDASELEAFDRLGGAVALPSIATSLAHSELWISISNSGVEIPPEQQALIFQQFYRIPNHNVWHQGSTGLGLTIAKKRVEKLRGSIAVSSENGQTTFTVKLPLNIPIGS